jgi:Fe-S-cluster containining protein
MKQKGEPDELKEVRAVYAALETHDFASQRTCQVRTKCCRFRLTGRTPMLTKGEAMVAAKALRAHGRKEVPEPIVKGECSFLKVDGMCRIYEGRPFGCRTHFCAEAGGMVEREEVIDLIRRLEVVDEALGGCGPLVIERAVGKVLAMT